MSQSSQEEVYEVESIRKKKITAGGNILYLIKWKDYSEDENTWEPIENLECQEMIDEFEAKENKEVIDEGIKNKKKTTTSRSSGSAKKVKEARSSSNASQRTGFDEGLTVEEILGATDTAGELMFLIKWKERNEASLISAKVANIKCPQQVIEYLETKITFLNE